MNRSMNKKRTRGATALAILALAIVAMAMGCARSGLERRAAVVSSMEDTRDYIARSRTQAAATMTTLNALPGKSGDALTAQYRLFVREFEQLQSLANDLGRQAERVRERGNAQLKAWQEEAATLQDPELRRRAEERREQQAARYAEFAREAEETQRTLNTFLTDLRDIRRYLDADLTPQGVEAIQDKLAQANQDVAPVTQSLARLNEELTALAQRVAPGGAAAPAGTAGASAGATGSGTSSTTGGGGASTTGSDASVAPGAGSSTPSPKQQ